MSFKKLFLLIKNVKNHNEITIKNQGLPGWSSGLRCQYFVLDHEERGGGPGFETARCLHNTLSLNGFQISNLKTNQLPSKVNSL